MTDKDYYVVELVRSGNTRAYTTLVDRHKDRAMTLAVRLLGRREEAEEIVQDAFLRAFHGLGNFRGNAKFGTWLYRILYNLCLTKISRRKNVPRPVDDADGVLQEEMVSEDDVSAQERMETEEVREMIGREVDFLPPKMKSAILLFYMQESSYEETAAVMEIPVGSVKTYLHRGRNLLRKRLVARMKQEERVS